MLEYFTKWPFTLKKFRNLMKLDVLRKSRKLKFKNIHRRSVYGGRNVEEEKKMFFYILPEWNRGKNYFKIIRGFTETVNKIIYLLLV